jgi:hypothetical protein
VALADMSAYNSIETTSSSLLLSIFEENLPNIFGINPVEFAILVGTVYYVFGPNLVYEYAREAGKLFSQYGPVGKFHCRLIVDDW